MLFFPRHARSEIAAVNGLDKSIGNASSKQVVDSLSELCRMGLAGPPGPKSDRTSPVEGAAL